MSTVTELERREMIKCITDALAEGVDTGQPVILLCFTRSEEGVEVEQYIHGCGMLELVTATRAMLRHMWNETHDVDLVRMATQQTLEEVLLHNIHNRTKGKENDNQVQSPRWH